MKSQIEMCIEGCGRETSGPDLICAWCWDENHSLALPSRQYKALLVELANSVRRLEVREDDGRSALVVPSADLRTLRGRALQILKMLG
jgi:hypothetical protein